MASYTTQDIRNIVLVGHASCGKTTLTERLLEVTKTIGRMGTVEDGNTASDFEPEEKHHNHSLYSAILHVDSDGARVNIIDTPGYPDFVGQAVSALAAVETVCVVIDANKGIENMTRRMMKLSKSENMARAIIINKIDGADNLESLVENIRDTFGTECLPINLPNKDGSSVITCFPEAGEGDAAFSSPADARSAIVDQVVEVDDDLMEKYLEEGEVTSEDLINTFTKAMSQGHLIPIFFTSAKEDAGVVDFLQIVTKYFPHPGDSNAVRFTTKSDDGVSTDWVGTDDPEKPFLAHVFRVTTDSFVGKLAALRVHQGKVKSGDSTGLDDNKKAVRLAHIFQLQGKDHVECEEAIPGDIVAVAKIDEMHYDAVLHEGAGATEFSAKPVPQPKPMFGLAVTAAKRGEEGKVTQSFNRLADEDPTFNVERNATTHEVVIRGIGELHLRIMIERLENRFNVEVNTAPPKIAYKETISVKANGHHRHKKQSGGAGQFGEVYLRVEPLPIDHETGFEFADETFGGSVPKQYMPAIEKGVRRVLQNGCIAGYPLQGIKIAVTDGKHHPVDSKEVAFVTAGKRAFMDAISKAKPILLEPYVHMEITTPSDSMGDITGDISGRRGRIQGTDMLPGDQAIISAIAPLSEVMTYAASLKAMTQGRGSYTMEYSHDEKTPANIQAEVIAAYKPHDDDD